MLAAVAGINSAAQAQVTYYNIWVDGIQVTSQNATTGIGGTGIKSGKVTYDANSSTLLLDNAVIVRGGNACIEIKEEKVKVKFRGVCALSCSSSNVDYPTVYISKSTDFVCEAGSYTTIYRSNSHAVWLYEDTTQLTINGPGQLVVDTWKYLDTDGVTVKSSSSGKSGFVGKNGTQLLVFKDGHNVTVNTRQACLWDFKDVQCAGNGLLYCMATNNSSEPCFVKVRALTLSGNQSVRLPSGASFDKNSQSIVLNSAKVYDRDVAIAGGDVVYVTVPSTGTLDGKDNVDGKRGQLKLYGRGFYAKGQKVTLMAVNDGPDKEGITFVGWKNDNSGTLMNTNMIYSFTASSDVRFIALYKYKQYTVTTTCIPFNGGTLSTKSTKGNFFWGSEVTLNAVPKAGCRFVCWRYKTSGNTLSTNAKTNLILKENYDLEAVFKKLWYNVIVAGETVTPENADNITSANMTGTAKYDFTTKTLTLTGVTINNVEHCIEGGEDLQKIVFNGTCSLTSRNCCIQYTRKDYSMSKLKLDITCASGSNVTMETTTSDQYQCIRFGYDSGDGDYSINGPGKLILNSNNGILVDGSLKFDNGHNVEICSTNEGIITDDGINDQLYIYGTGELKIKPSKFNSYAIKDFNDFRLNNSQIIFSPDGAVWDHTNKRISKTGTVYIAQGYYISVKANNSSYGTVSGGGSKLKGSSVTVTATPNTGYKFVRWTENGSQVSTSASYTFTVDKARTLQAVFEKLTYSITASASPAAGGTVSGGGTKEHGSSVTLTATPNTGYKFVRWTEGGSQVSTNASYTFTVSGARSLTAVFEKLTYTIAISASPAAGGTVTGGGTKEHGESVTVKATPNTGYKFVRWTEGGSQVSASASYTFTADKNRTLVAVFEEEGTPDVAVTGVSLSPTTKELKVGEKFTLVPQISPSNATNQNVTWISSDATVATVSNGEVTAEGVGTATITVSTVDGNKTATCEVTVSAAAATTYALTIVSPTNGTLTASPSGYISEGTEVTLTATPASGYKLKALKAYKTGEASTTVAINGNKFNMPGYPVTVEAEFEDESSAETHYPLTVVSPTNGTLTASPSGYISEGTEVTLTATPASGYKLKALKAYKTGEVSTTVAITGNKFNMPAYEVTVEAEFEKTSSGGGGGGTTYYMLTYTASAGGSIKGASMQTVAQGGSGQEVEAVAQEGYRFVKWSDGRTTAKRTDYNVQGNLTVTAEFEKLNTTGIFDTKLDALSVYPNPTQGVLWVSVPELAEGTAAEMHVYNASGQLLQCVPAHGASAGSAASRLSIDLSGYSAGMYIIRVGNAMAKVVKQ